MATSSRTIPDQRPADQPAARRDDRPPARVPRWIAWARDHQQQAGKDLTGGGALA